MCTNCNTNIYNCNCNESNCDENTGCPITLKDTCVINSLEETMSSIGLEPGEDLKVFFNKLDEFLLNLNPSDFNFSELDIVCFEATSLSEFIEEVSLKTCTLQSTFNSFQTSVNNSLNLLNNSIDALNTVTVSKSGITQTFTRANFDQRTFNKIDELELFCTLAGIEWDSCFTVSDIPTTLKEAFETIINMYCSLTTTVNGFVPDNKKLRISLLDTTDGFLSEKLTSSCLDITIFNSGGNEKIRIEPKVKPTLYTFSNNFTQTTISNDCYDEIAIGLDTSLLPNNYLTSIGLEIGNNAQNVLTVPNSPLTSNGNLELTFSSQPPNSVLLCDSASDIYFDQLRGSYIETYTLSLDHFDYITPYSLIGSFDSSGEVSDLPFNRLSDFDYSPIFSLKNYRGCYDDSFSDLFVLPTSPFSEVVVFNASVNDITLGSSFGILSVPDRPTLGIRYDKRGYINTYGVLNIDVDMELRDEDGFYNSTIDIPLYELSSCLSEVGFEYHVDSKTIRHPKTVLIKACTSHISAFIYKHKGTNTMFVRINVVSDLELDPEETTTQIQFPIILTGTVFLD